ncbi:MAG TPA: signal peptidase I [Clostridiaceae bacterium]|nr:signal peptidase I [Clostridiaceae bacterium]
MDGLFYGIGVLALFLLVRRFLWFTVVDAHSMSPTLESGDRRLTMKTSAGSRYRRGEVLVFHSREYGRDMVKRLVGLPGERISIRDGKVFVQGKPLGEPYAGDTDVYQGEFLIPKGKYFFLGDNRAYSLDSRVWEEPFIPGEDIKGRLLLKGRHRSDQSR